MNGQPGFALLPALFVILAIAAGWALMSHRRRLGLVLTVVGLALIAYAVTWTFLPE